MDSDTNDIVSNGLGNALTRDGQGVPTADLPMSGFRHTGVQNGVARSDYGALGQAQDGVLNWVVAGGTSDAITATFVPALTNLNDGQLCFVRAAAANTTSTPTFAPNGLTPETITKLGGAPLSAGDIAGNLAEVVLRYNLANTRWELLNPAASLVPTGTVLTYAKSTAPAGFLACDGSAVSRTTYAALFALIATTFGAGDGSTTFNIPDMRARVPTGYDSGGASGRMPGNGISPSAANFASAGGESSHTLIAGESAVLAYTSSVSDPTHSHGPGTYVVGAVSTNATGGPTGSGGAVNQIGNAVTGTSGASGTGITVSTSSNAGGGSHNNVQPTLVLSYIIKT